MRIHKAVAKALQRDRVIARRCDPRYMFKPTNGRECIIVTREKRKPGRGWQPRANDLTAKDWFVVSHKKGMADVNESI